MERTIRKNNRFEILTPNGWASFDGILRKKVGGVVTIQAGDTELGCTEDHRLKACMGEFVEAKSLRIGDILSSGDVVTDLEFIHEECYVYDPLNVSDGNEYYSGGLVSHNCEFIGSSGTLIAGWKLKEMRGKTPQLAKDGHYQYAAPEPGRAYALAADVSRGKGLDYSAFSVFDITQTPYQQVYVYRNNLITPLDYADVIHHVAKMYNGAAVLVEINEIGGQVVDSLHFDYEYDNILYTESAGRAGKRVASGFSGQHCERGIRTTTNTKATGCSLLKLLIEQNQMIVNDQECIRELYTFSRKNKSYEAEPGNHDDLVMGMLIFAWLADQQYFKELTSLEALKAARDKTEEQYDEEITPFGFVVNGMEEMEAKARFDNPKAWFDREAEFVEPETLLNF